MHEDLAERIARIEAREQIRDLVSRYGMAVDDRDLDGVGSLFTADGVFRHGGNSVVNHGRAEIVEFYTDRLSAFGPTYHYPHSHLIDISDEVNATGTVNAHAELGHDGKTYVTALRYNDTYRREDGEWLFAERRLQMLYYMDMVELVEGGLDSPDRKRYFGTVGPADIPENLPSWRDFFGES